MKRLWYLIVFSLLPAAAFGQAPTSANVVANCGTPNSTYSANQNAPTTQDTAGKACVNATVTATATVAVAALTSTNLSGTISVTNTFQSIQVLTSGRNGCNIQNNGTHTMWVFFGAIGGATEAKSFQLTAGQTISCSVGGLGVLTDQVSITGTSGDAFVANFQ